MSRARDLFEQFKQLKLDTLQDRLDTILAEDTVLEFKFFHSELHSKQKQVGKEKKDSEKRSHVPSKEQQEKLADVLCGMANFDGGVVLLGVQENRKHGSKFIVQEIPKVSLLAHWFSQNASAFLDPPQSIEIFPLEAENGEGVLLLFIDTALDRPVLTRYSQQAFLRRNEDTHLATAQDHRMLRSVRPAPRLEFELRLISGQRTSRWDGPKQIFSFHVILKNYGPVILENYAIHCEPISNDVEKILGGGSFIRAIQKPIDGMLGDSYRNVPNESLLPGFETVCGVVEISGALVKIIEAYQSGSSFDEADLGAVVASIKLYSQNAQISLEITMQDVISILRNS